MPLVRIDVEQAVTPAKLQAISNQIHEAIVETFGIPVEDRFHVLNRLPSGSLVAEDAGLGFSRSASKTIVQIFTQRGRSTDLKQSLYFAIATRLESIGIPGTDVFIGYQENGPEDWSFGFGRAQYLTGELSIPRAR